MEASAVGIGLRKQDYFLYNSAKRHRVGRFVHVVRLSAVVSRRAESANVRMRVDDPRRDVLPGAVDGHRVGWRSDRHSHLCDLAIAKQHAAIANRRSGCRQNGHVANEGWPGREPLVRAGEGIGIGGRHAAQHGSRVARIARRLPGRLSSARCGSPCTECESERGCGVTHRAGGPRGGWNHACRVRR